MDCLSGNTATTSLLAKKYLYSYTTVAVFPDAGAFAKSALIVNPDVINAPLFSKLNTSEPTPEPIGKVVPGTKLISANLVVVVPLKIVTVTFDTLRPA